MKVIIKQFFQFGREMFEILSTIEMSKFHQHLDSSELDILWIFIESSRVLQSSIKQNILQNILTNTCPKNFLAKLLWSYSLADFTDRISTGQIQPSWVSYLTCTMLETIERFHPKGFIPVFSKYLLSTFICQAQYQRLKNTIMKKDVILVLVSSTIKKGRQIIQ